MDIKETTAISATITVTDTNGNSVTVAYLNANLDASTMNYGMSINVVNKALMTANATIVKQQYTDFMAAIAARGKELSYPIFE